MNKRPMRNNKMDEDALENEIIRILNERKPKSVKELSKLIKDEIRLDEEKIIQVITRLQDHGKIRLENKPLIAPPKLIDFLKTSQARWYWLTEGIAVTTTIVALIVGGDSYPWIYLRYALGALFAIWLPGYTFIKALFPVKLTPHPSTESLSTVERVALSLGMSLALVSIVGMLLNYSPLGVRPAPLLLSLLGLTSIFAIIAVVREHMISIKRQGFGR